MDRRDFLKGIAAGVLATSVPLRGFDALAGDTVIGGGAARTTVIVDPDTLRDGGKFIIDPTRRTLGFTEYGEKVGCTLQELYSFLKEAWKDDVGLLPEPFPMDGITPEYMLMKNDWSMDMSRPAALRVGCIEELDGTKWASMVGLGTWEPDGLILSRDGKPQVEDVNPHHHIVKLEPGMKTLKWQAVCVDDESPLMLSRKTHDDMQKMYPNVAQPDYDPSTYDTSQLGIMDIYAQTNGSIRFPIPHLPQRPSEVRADVRRRITNNMMMRRTTENGA